MTRKSTRSTAVATRTVETAAPEKADGKLCTILRRDDGAVQDTLDADALRAAVASGEGTLWVDLDVSDPAQATLLKDVFNFHPLAIEDALNASSRVKVDEYPTFLVVVARVVSFADSTPDPYDLETANLTIFITKNAVVTAHLQNLPIVQSLVATLKANPDLLQRGPARIAHFVLDGAVDAYFPVLDRLDEFVDEIEERVFGKFDEQLLQEIFKVKRLVISLRRFLAPQREVLSQLTMRPSPFLPSEAQLYFRDVYDHMLRITDSLDSYRDLLSSTLDAYLTQVSNRLGYVSKALAAVGALSVPFVVIAGVYGMNFEHIPLSHHPHGFEIMVGVQVVLAVSFLLALRYKKMV
jgi:magnesium transporter